MHTTRPTAQMSANVAQQFLAICGKTVDEVFAVQEAQDLLTKHTAKVKARKPSESTPQFTELVQAPTVAKYDGMTDAELRAELCVRTSAFVSPNMTTAQVRTKLEALDAEAQVAVKAKPNAPKTQRLGVGKRQVELLKEGKTVDETLTIIQEEFPTAKTTKACVAWYKSKIKAGLY